MAVKKRSFDLKFNLQDVARIALGEKSRVATCQRLVKKGVGGREQSRGISVNEEGNAHFHGVSACGDVWTCAICSNKISEGRRNEIMHAMRKNREQGGACIMPSFTFSHSRNDKLEIILNKFLKAMSRMKACREYKDIRDNFQLIGSIRALEVTHGWQNGWHPHSHEIWFLPYKPTKLQVMELENQLFLLWKKYAVKHGLSAPNHEHGVKISFRESDNNDETIGAYVAKFGNELTGAMKKTGNKNKVGRSPWAIMRTMLAQKINRERSINKKERPAYKNLGLWDYSEQVLLQEYAKAFYGKAQLFWSRGLKERFQVEEVKDADLANRKEKIFIRDLSYAEWSAILWARARGRVLELATSYGFNKPLFLDDYIFRCVEYHEAWMKLKREEKREQSKKFYNDSIRHLQKLMYQEVL